MKAKPFSAKRGDTIRIKASNALGTNCKAGDTFVVKRRVMEGWSGCVEVKGPYPFWFTADEYEIVQPAPR